MKYIIGNWKANKNVREVQLWIDTFKSKNLEVTKGQLEIVICVPYPFIPLMNEAFSDYENIHIGAQDISQYGAGTYTGEVSAHSLQGLVDYVLIGHSERRKYFHETDNSVDQKVQNALEADIEPIVIVNDTHAIIPDNVSFVTYEPADKISSGNLVDGQNEDVDIVTEVKSKLQMPIDAKFIYGASVSPSNIREYMQHHDIDGVLPGAASLDPETFYELIELSLHTS